MFTLTLSNYFRSQEESWLHINVVVNWQLSKQGVRWPVSPDRIAGLGVDPSRSIVFLKVFRWQFTRFQMIAGSVFLNSYQICCVYVTIAQHYYDFDFKLTSDAKIQPFFLKYLQGDLFLPWSRAGHDPRPIFMLWLVKIWRVSSCVKFMQHLESCLFLTAEADRVLSQLVMFLTVFFHWM